MNEPPPAAPAPRDAPPTGRGVRIALVLVAIALVALGGWWWFRGRAPAAPAASAATSARPAKSQGMFGAPGRPRRGTADTGRPQPVAAAVAKRGDVNVVLAALGTVSPLQTVTVHPRVDGQLRSVAFTEGQMVKKGQLLARIDPTSFEVALQQVQGQLARDQAALASARQDLQRYRTLLAQDSIAAQQVDQQSAQVKQLEGTVKVDEAQVANARLQLSYTRVTAPIDGRVGLRQVDPGNMVRTSDASGIAVIAQLDPIAVLFAIPQDRLPQVMGRLRSGDKPEVAAWDQAQKTLLARGHLLTVDNQIDVATGTVKAKAEMPNPEARLFPNEFVNVRMVVDTVRDTVVVPTAAIQRATGGAVVYVVRPDDTVALRPVKTGPTEGEVTAVASGLKPGERVVTDGVDRIREGSKVEVTRPGGGKAPAQ